MQLRPGDHFIISSRRFSITIFEPDPALLIPSVSDHSMVVDREEDEAGNADINLPLQDGGNAGPASASTARLSLPGDEIDLLESANVVDFNDADIAVPSSESKLPDADFRLVGTSAAEGGLLYSTEGVERVDQNTEVIGKEISLTRTAAEQQQNDLSSEEELPKENGGLQSDEASTKALKEGGGPPNSTMVELETREPDQQEAVSPGIGISRAILHSEVEASTIDAISHGVAQNEGKTLPAHPEPKVTFSTTLLIPPIPEDDKQLGGDAKSLSFVALTEANGPAGLQGRQQILNEQDLEAAPGPSEAQLTEHNDTNPVEGPISSSPKSSRDSSCQLPDALLGIDSKVQSTFLEDSAREANVLPEAQDIATPSSTTARVNDLFHLVDVDSDLNNNIAQSEGEFANFTPRKATLATEVGVAARNEDRPTTSMDLATIGDVSTDSGAEVD